MGACVVFQALTMVRSGSGADARATRTAAGASGGHGAGVPPMIAARNARAAAPALIRVDAGAVFGDRVIAAVEVGPPGARHAVAAPRADLPTLPEAARPLGAPEVASGPDARKRSRTRRAPCPWAALMTGGDGPRRHVRAVSSHE